MEQRIRSGLIALGLAMIGLLFLPIWPKTHVSRGHWYEPNPDGRGLVIAGPTELRERGRTWFWESDYLEPPPAPLPPRQMKPRGLSPS